MKITIIDGQGGRIGRTVIEQLKKKHEHLELYAIGTNSAATAVSASRAFKILIPVNRCNHYIAGLQEAPMGDYIRSAVEKIESFL